MSNDTADATATFCQNFLTPNTDIAGIGVRISVYVQTFFCIILCLFREADELVDGAFRNAVLFLYAIGFAIVLSPDRSEGKISLQTYIVLHSTVSMLLLSSFALMSYYPALRPKPLTGMTWRASWKHTSGLRKALALLGAVPLALWVWVTLLKQIENDQCADFSRISKTDVKGIPYYMGVWAGSMAAYLPTLPLFALLWFLTRFKKGPLRYIPLLFWLASWVLMVVTCEVAIKTVNYVGPGNEIAPNPAGMWAFGQVIAVVMLFSQFWDIVFYPFGLANKRHQSEGNPPIRRYHWWYHHHFLVDMKRFKNFILRRKPADTATPTDEESAIEKVPSTLQEDAPKEAATIQETRAS